MNILFIRELRIDTIIGVYEWEKRNKQELIIDIEVAADISKAIESDDLQYTLDYKAIADRLTDYVESHHFNLVEALAEGAAQVLQKEFGASWLRLRIAKPGPLDNARDVGVIIERGEKP
ncbi:dihydroneopterin aldolase [Gilvimarinus sp. F26214L]|uniref:dihydroneopterin aldolase n=1 Tax=Gilvimarinus sp. DZF01 TaxID=3461371 RepID=UPI004045DFED